MSQYVNKVTEDEPETRMVTVQVERSEPETRIIPVTRIEEEPAP
jgi:hypothetical protein